jgi:hypothetical protein
MTTKSLKINALRVCDAIAKIGYTPPSALMDLVDNSVTAQSTKVFIKIERNPELTLSKSNNVLSYTIIDNGRGMDESEIERSLTLGSEDLYPPGSLSKFGMGLKSAGFSLGARISVFSRKNGSTCGYVLSRENIEATGEWTIQAITDHDPYINELNECFRDIGGTIIKIEKTDIRPHQSAKKTIDAIKAKSGIVYDGFLRDGKLELYIIHDNEVHAIKAQDILHLNDCLSSYDPDIYDCSKPCKASEENIIIHPEKPPAKLIICLFPQHNMSRHEGFDPETRERIKGYNVSTELKGFFIYRNGRLIRWGDNLDGIVSRSEFGFRARIDLTDDHDEAFHVDVSKQHLAIPDDIMKNIERICMLPKRWHKDIFDKCDFLRSQSESDGKEFNERTADIADDDFDPSDDVSQIEKTKRKQRIIEKTKEIIKDDQGSKDTTDSNQTSTPAFQRIRYSSDVRGSNIWEALQDPVYGVFARINQNHDFYQSILRSLLPNDPSRIALEAVVWSLANAEIKTILGSKLSPEESERFIADFKRCFASTIEVWCSRNYDLFSTSKS